MNLVCLASHTIDLDALPESPIVLDVGCRGFDFTAEVLKLRPGATLIALDPSPELTREGAPVGTLYIQKALVGDDRQTALFSAHSTGEGNCVCDVEVPWYAQKHTVECINIRALMERTGVAYWDLVKLDCEGSEYGILENWPGQIAGQISVEFHDWTGPWEGYVKGDYYDRLWAGPLKDYELVRHPLLKVGEGWGHWDSLLILK